MASNNDQKSQARAKREAAQAAAEAAAKRTRNLQILGGVLFAAIAVVILVVAFSGGKNGGNDAPDPESDKVAGIEETKRLLDGVQQRGLTIGDADAPVTVLEFVDVQCPFCRDSFLDELPGVVNELVKTGKVKVRLQPIALAMMGEDSEAGRAVLLRLARQNKGWNFANLFYFNQGQETTGYVTAEYLSKLVKAAGGTEADTKREPDAEDEKTIEEIERLVEEIGVTGTPSYAIGRSGTDPASFELVSTTGDGSLADKLGAAAEKIQPAS